MRGLTDGLVQASQRKSMKLFGGGGLLVAAAHEPRR